MFSVSGGPADCVLVALHEILKGKKPDLVISGINRGANLGQDVFYSGTASGAREAANQNIPSMAVSLSLDFAKSGVREYFETAAKCLSRVLDESLRMFGASSRSKWRQGLRNWHSGMMLNVNVPNLPLSRIRGSRLATQGYRIYSASLIRRTDFRGKDYYWIGGKYQGYKKIEDSDCWYVDRGYVSVTPLELDTTMKDLYLDMKMKWKG
jgi:5'-nucleotidase